MEDDMLYLQPGFTLSSLTVPKLRSILVSHDISYPSSAKKPQLIQLIEAEVLPQSRRLLNARARTRRTSRGITDMPSSQESSAAEGDSEKEMPPPPDVPARTPRARKSKASLAAEVDSSATTPVARKTKTPSRGASTIKHSRGSDTETEAEKLRPSTRKTRKSEGPTSVTPAHVQISEPDLPIKSGQREKGDSPFVDDNPFQSGSPPPGDSRRVSASSSRSRKSLGSAKEDRRKSSHARRKTTHSDERAVQQDDGIMAPSRSTFEFPVANVKVDHGQDDLETTEEFTPEEQQDLIRSGANRRAAGRKVSALRRSTLTRQRRKSSTIATRAITWGVLVTLLSSVGTWYRKEKIDIGYCGVGQAEWSLSDYNTNIPAWVTDNLQPACEPCPQHAFCYPDMEVRCEQDFVLMPHPLSLGGLIPLPPTCEPDGEKVRRVKAVADRAVEELRERRAAYECGEDFKQSSATIGDEERVAREASGTVAKSTTPKLEISEEALREEVGKLRRKGMSDADFDDLWQGALGEITGREEVEVIRDGTGRIFLSSVSLARLSLGCAIRRSFLQTLSRNRLPLSILMLLFVSAIYARQKLSSYRTSTAQIPALVTTTLDRLATQAARAEQGHRGINESFISVGHLRDSVLRSTFNKLERERVWAGVTAIVEQNSNVRAGNREVGRTGEWSRVWEWIGPVDMDADASKERLDTDNADADNATAAEARDGMRSGRAARAAVGGRGGRGDGEEGAVERRKWNEGRPIY